jgi:hypothetical protein
MKEGEIHPPVRAGQSLPGPGGEMLRWVKKGWLASPSPFQYNARQ